MSDSLASCFMYALGDVIRYRPSHPPKDGPWSPDPWRIVGRSLTQMAQLPDAVSYFIQPSTLTGTWALDRPIAALPHQLAPWPKEETSADV